MMEEIKALIKAEVKAAMAGEEAAEDESEKKEAPASMEELKAKRDEVLDSKEEEKE